MHGVRWPVSKYNLAAATRRSACLNALAALSTSRNGMALCVGGEWLVSLERQARATNNSLRAVRNAMLQGI